MRHPNALDASRAALVVVDLQERFRPAIFEFEQIVARSTILVQGAKLLGLPILVTEQNPEKLGATVQEITAVLPSEAKALGKMAFSCCGAKGFTETLKDRSIKQVILCGIETHVCVNQTAHDLLAQGFQVHLAMDCISSRSERDRTVGFEKMRNSGAIPTCVEMSLFELMIDATHPRFRDIQKLVK